MQTLDRRRWILVVEDDDDFRECMQEILESSGHATAAAKNGLEALALLEGRAQPGLILLDLNMPLCSGREFLHTLRERRGFRHTPVIAVSGEHAPSVAEASGHLAKPFDVDQLLAVVRRYATP